MTRPNHEDDGSRSSDESARQDRPTSDPVGQPDAISELPEMTIQSIADLWTELLVRDLQRRPPSTKDS